MALWRWMTEEESEAVHAMDTPPPPDPETMLHLYEVVEGRVRRAGTEGEGEPAEPGWFARTVELGDIVVPDWAYEVVVLRVKMNGAEVDLLPGGLVALLPPNYRELADGAA